MINFLRKIFSSIGLVIILTITNLKAQTITDPWMTFSRYRPSLVVTDGLGNVYAVSSNIISKITSTGVVTQAWATLANDAIPVGIAIDGSGNIYTSNNAINTISKVTSTGVVTQVWATLASNARPYGIAIDFSGNVYTGNQGNSTISKVSPAGLVTQAWATLATDNSFNRIAIDGLGNVYKTNWSNGTISKIASTGVVTQTWASGVGADEMAIDGSGNVYTSNSFNSTISKVTSTGVVNQAWVTLASGTRPSGIAIDGTGNIYILEPTKINKVTSTGVLTQAWATLASDSYSLDLAIDGSGNIYTANESNSSISKVTSSGLVTQVWAALPKLVNPKIIAIDNNGNLNVSFNYNLATISPLGSVTQTIQGIQTQAIAIDNANNIYTNNNNSVVSFVNSSGVADINWAKLKLSSSPIKLVIDGSGNIYSANRGNNTISKVTPSGGNYQVWATLASGNDQSLQNGANPIDIAIDGSGNVYTANNSNNTISKVTSAGVVTQAWATLSTNPNAIAIDASGNLYTANGNSTISKVTSAGIVTQAWATLSTNPIIDIAIDASGNLYTVNGNNIISKVTSAGVVTQAWATLANNAYPWSIAIDGSGNIYTLNQGNNTISKVTSAGIVTQAWATLATNTITYFSNIAIDALGNLYTTNGNSTISKVTSAGAVTQAWATLISGAGSLGLAIDGSGNVYSANNSNNTISKVSSAGAVTQEWATLITGAYPSGVAIDNSGNVFTANTTNNTISKITTGGIVTQEWATLASGAKPYSIVIDGSGNLFTANGNNTVSKITSTGAVTQAWATLASDAIPSGIIIDQSGNLYTSNNGNSTISKITTPSGVVTQAWATLGNGANKIAIVMDQLGNIYSCIAKTGNNTISKINSNGIITQIYVDQSSYIYNQSIAVDKKNDVYVVNLEGQKIIKISNCNTPIPTPTITSINATSFCQGVVDTLKSNATTGNQWYLNGNPISGATDVNYIANASGNYTVVASNSGCSSGVSSATSITAIPSPQTPIITSINATSFCQGGVDTLKSNATTGNQWYLNGKAISGATGVNYIANASGNYNVVASNSGCSSGVSSATTITAIPSPPTPIITSLNDTSFCQGGVDTLKSNIITGNQWYLNGNKIQGATGVNYIANASGNYTVVAINSGCSSGVSSATTIKVNPSPPTPIITSLNATSFCQGGVDTLKSNATTGNQWYLNGKAISGATGVNYIANASGNYTDSVTNSNGCKNGSIYTTILVNPIPLVPTLSRDSSNFLTSTGNKNLWFKDGFQLSDTLQKIKPTIGGSYTAKANINGCLSSASASYYYLVTDMINLSSDEFIKLAPNPFINQLNFDFVVKGYQRLNLEVFDVATGMKKASMQNLTPGMPINLSQLSGGTYILKVSSNDGKIYYQFKMVKL